MKKTQAEILAIVFMILLLMFVFFILASVKIKKPKETSLFLERMLADTVVSVIINPDRTDKCNYKELNQQIIKNQRISSECENYIKKLIELTLEKHNIPYNFLIISGDNKILELSNEFDKCENKTKYNIITDELIYIHDFSYYINLTVCKK